MPAPRAAAGVLVRLGRVVPGRCAGGASPAGLGARRAGAGRRRHVGVPAPPLAPAAPRPGRGAAALFAPGGLAEPAACGTCHPVQYGDWRRASTRRPSDPAWPASSSRCGAANPPPRSGVTRVMPRSPSSARSCARRTGFEPNPAFDRRARRPGGAVRRLPRARPPALRAAAARRVAGEPAPRASLPHDGVTRTPAFLSSRVLPGLPPVRAQRARPERQAAAGHLQRVEGEPLRAARACSARTATCPTAATSGAASTTPTWCARGSPSRRGPTPGATGPADWATLTLTVTSTRVGHAFPTYVTPRVVLRGELIDAEGRSVAGHPRERVIAREVALDLSREFRDTRLRPGRARRARVSPRARRGRSPRAPQRGRRARRLLHPLLRGAARQGAGRGEAQIREALEAAAARRSSCSRARFP